MAQYKRQNACAIVQASALVKLANGSNGVVTLAALVAIGYNPKARHQSFWGTGKTAHGARPCSQRLHGMGYTVTVNTAHTVANGVRTPAYTVTLAACKPFGRFAPTA